MMILVSLDTLLLNIRLIGTFGIIMDRYLPIYVYQM